MNTSSIILLCVAVLMMAILVTISILFIFLFRLWLQCFLSGAPVPVFNLVAMYMRSSPARLICEQRIKASHVGVELRVEQLENAHKQGANIEKLVDALCVSRRDESNLTWDDLLQT